MALPRRSAGAAPLQSGYADVSELEKYKMISCIGKGSFGVITKVERIADGKVRSAISFQWSGPPLWVNVTDRATTADMTTRRSLPSNNSIIPR
jgi:hypothetical protein